MSFVSDQVAPAHHNHNQSYRPSYSDKTFKSIFSIEEKNRNFGANAVRLLIPPLHWTFANEQAKEKIKQERNQKDPASQSSHVTPEPVESYEAEEQKAAKRPLLLHAPHRGRQKRTAKPRGPFR